MTNGQYGSETPYAATVRMAIPTTGIRAAALIGVLLDDGWVHVWKNRLGEQHTTVPKSVWMALVETHVQGRWSYSQMALVHGGRALVPHTLEYCVALYGR